MTTYAGVDRARQIDDEQRSIDALYACLDAEIIRARAARERVMASPVEGPEARYMRDVELSRLTGTIRRLRSAEQSLCFGRIDDADGDASVHIGRVGLRPESGGPVLVDWRAAAARPFYAATMASPLGLRRRRHLRLENRRVVDVADEILDGTAPTGADIVGDGPLASALSRARTGRMREAAATLQREQDEIVRSGHRGVTVVDGGPGTGKTIVALHRAAYVLYAFPSIAERGVLVCGPSRRFLGYISDVLPSLGENHVDLATLPDLAGTEATRSEPEGVARIKGRRCFAEVLARWVQARQPHGVPLRLHTAHGCVVLEASVVDGARRSAVQGGVGHNRARDLFVEYITDELVNELERRTAQEVTDFEDELRDVLGIDLDRMFGDHSDHAGSGDTASSAGELDIDWDRIRDELRDDAGIDRALSEVWPRLRPEDVLRDVLADRVALVRALPELTEEGAAVISGGARAGWTSADLALLDEARTLVDGPPGTVYGHIVVDEAQLLSEMHWRMLMRRCPNRSLTIVGDLAQAGPTTTVTSWADVLEPFVADRYVHHCLTVNYRTTAEILEATVPVLARIAPTQLVSRSIRHGDHPTHITVADGDVGSAVGTLVAQLRDEHAGGLIGVIAAPRRASDIDVGGDDVTIVAAPDARGLEFDTVVVVGPDEIEHASEAGLRDLYVAQTRATTRLTTLTIDPVGTRARPTGRPRP